MVNFIKALESVYDSIYLKKPVLSAKRLSYYVPLKPKVAAINREFLAEYPIAKFLEKGKIQKYFKDFALQMLDEAKTNNDTSSRGYSFSSTVLSALKHADTPVKCENCSQLIDKQYTTIFLQRHKNPRYCYLCLPNKNVSRCTKCGRIFDARDWYATNNTLSLKAYPILVIAPEELNGKLMYEGLSFTEWGELAPP